MPTALQFRRGTTSQNNSFTGAVGEVSVDTTLDTLRLHDGSTAGGFTITQNAAAQTLTNKTLTTPVIAEIDSGSTITLDATTDIILDAGSGDILLKDDGTTYGGLINTSGNLIIKSGTTTAATFSGANTTFAGTVASGAFTSSSTVTATQAILSNASPLVFEGNTADSFETTIAVTDPTADRTITIPNATDTLVGRATTDTLTNKTLTTPVIAEIDNSGSITLDAGADIVLDADGADIVLKDGGTTYGALNNNGGELRIQSGSSPTTSITMSGANVTIAGNLTVSGSTTTIDSSTVSVTNSFTFEGATADSFETTLAVEDPTADRTVTIPNATTQLVGRDTTDTLTNKTLTTPVIAEIDSGAAITLDATTDIILDADGDNITMKAAGTTVLDFVLNGATDVTLDAPGDIKVDADGGDILLLDGGNQFGSLTNNSNNLIIKSGTTTAATFSGANTTLAGTLDVGSINTTGSLVFEGGTADSFETTLTVADPTADRTITFQNGSGTVAFLTDVTGGGAAAFSNVELSGGVIFEGSTANSFETTLNVVDSTADRTINLPDDSGTLLLNNKAIDMNGTELILDADADTSITADTDDTIHFKIGGSDLVTFTAGLIDLKNAGAQSAINFYCESSNAHAQKLQGAPHSESASNTLTLPSTGGNAKLVSASSTETLTNKTLTSPDIGTSIELLARAEARFQDASGGQFVALEAPATVSSSFVLTLPAADGSAGQFLKTDGSGALSFDTVSSAADDLTAGDAAINLTTTSGNITIDAQANDSDIIFKGTDGNSDTTFLTIDGSAAGAAAFNDAVTATSFTSTGASTFDGVNITEDGTIVFEGASNNSFETTLTVTDPTADRTITFPNETFKVASYANKATLDGNGSATTISVAAGYDVDQFLVTINGVMQEATEDFTYSGSTITLDAAPASGDRVVVRY